MRMNVLGTRYFRLLRGESHVKSRIPQTRLNGNAITLNDRKTRFDIRMMESINLPRHAADQREGSLKSHETAAVIINFIFRSMTEIRDLIYRTENYSGDLIISPWLFPREDLLRLEKFARESLFFFDSVVGPSSAEENSGLARLVDFFLSSDESEVEFNSVSLILQSSYNLLCSSTTNSLYETVANFTVCLF